MRIHTQARARSLDIGGDIGALVVTMPRELEGVEVEINRIDLATGAIAASQNHDHLHSHDHHHLHDPAKNMITTESMIMSIHMIMRRTVHT